MEMLSLESCSTFNLQPYSNSRLQNVGRTRKAVLSIGNCRHQQLHISGIQSLQIRKRSSDQARLPTFPVSCYCHNGECTVSEADKCSAEGTLVLKSKAEEVSLGLDGKSIFLVGMMGCGKTTVGKILSEALGYYFFDSDKLIEESAGGKPVAQIFKEKNEEYFMMKMKTGRSSFSEFLPARSWDLWVMAQKRLRFLYFDLSCKLKSRKAHAGTNQVTKHDDVVIFFIHTRLLFQVAERSFCMQGRRGTFLLKICKLVKVRRLQQTWSRSAQLVREERTTEMPRGLSSGAKLGRASGSREDLLLQRFGCSSQKAVPLTK